jgi:hypothetical protein
MMSSDMFLTPSNPSSALLRVFWNISAAEETPKLRNSDVYIYVILQADLKKISAIRNTQIPTDVGEVRSVLAMTNYVGRFIPNYSTVTESLRRLTKQGAQWEWTIEHQQSFYKLKNELVADRVMSYCDPNKEKMLHLPVKRT